MRWRDFQCRVVGGVAAAWLCAAGASAVTVDFDDRAGKPGPFTTCQAQYQIDDEYAGLGVHFASTDPAVCVIEPSSGAPSPPNVVAGISGGNISFFAPILASFFAGAQPVAVASVTLELTGSSVTTVEAYDINGVLLGSSGTTGPGTHSLYFPQQIHSVRVDNGSFAMDDFSFTTPGPPEAIPVLPLAGRIAMPALLAAVALRGLRRACPLDFARLRLAARALRALAGICLGLRSSSAQGKVPSKLA